MAPTAKTGSTKGSAKRSSKPSSSGPTSKAKKARSAKPAPKPTPQKTKSKTDSLKKKPPHLRYTEKELKVPQLNGIRPAGVQKPPNAKKGKKFVDDKEQMNAIMAIVMAEKEGNIESKMMRARQLEEVREARRLEAEKRAESKKAGLEDRKQAIKDNKRKRRHTDTEVVADETESKPTSKKPKKRVSFG
jgi:60S ribosomal subunit assembly/export protein LOC1